MFVSLFAPILSLQLLLVSPITTTSMPSSTARAPFFHGASSLPFDSEALSEWTNPWSWMQTPAPTAKASVPEAFIPANAMFVLRFDSVDAAVHAIEPFVPAGVISGMSDPLDMLKLIAQTDIPVDQIDGSRPILIAMRPSDTHPPMETTFIVTCKDPALFSAPLTKAGWSCTTSGKIVACSLSEPGPVLASDSPLRIGLDRHDVVLRVAMDEVMDQFGDDVHSGIDEIAQEAESDPSTSKAAVTKMFNGIREAVDSVEMFEVGLSIVGDEARVTLEMTATKGSDLASVEKVDTRNLPDIARLIDPDASIACITALDFSKLLDSFQWAVDAAAAEVPDAEKPRFDSAMKTVHELYALVGPTMGVSASIDQSGVHGLGLMSATDPAAYILKMADVVKTTVPWMKITGPELSKVDGVDVSTFHFEFDLDSMPQAAGLDDDAKEKQRIAAEKGLKAFFGPDGLSVSMASRNGALVFGIGGASEMHAAFTRMASKSPSSIGADMLEQLGKMNPGLVYHFDLAQLFDGALDIARLIDPSTSTPKSSELEMVRAFPPITIAAGVEGRVWRLVFATDAEKMKAMVQRFGDLQPKPMTSDSSPTRERAIEDIGMIVDALDAYAENNAGKYPDTLQPLITKDANGKRYLDMDTLPVDPWGRVYLYDPPKDADGDPRVYTYGADGKEGGDGEDEDLDNDSD